MRGKDKRGRREERGKERRGMREKEGGPEEKEGRMTRGKGRKDD